MRYTFYILITIMIISCKQNTQSLTDVQFQNIRQDIETLSSDEMEGRKVGTDGERRAAKYIASRFASIGLDSIENYEGYFQHFMVEKSANPHEGASTMADSVTNGINLVGYIDNKAEHTIVLGAHYDHLGYGGFGSLHIGDPEIHNGADDNASGVSMLICLAEMLTKGPTDNNYLFIAFSGEEMGLWGSNYFVKHAHLDLSNINYMVNMDMVGRLNEERKLLVYGTGTSDVWQTAIDTNNIYEFQVISSESGMGPTDHTSFYVEDIPVLSFFTGQHEDYHKPSDDAHLINYEGIRSITNYVYKIISDLDDNGKLNFIKTKDEEQTKMSFKVTLGVMPDYLYTDDGMRIDGVRPDRPADNAGIIKGDIVIKMGDIDIKNMDDYMKALGAFEPGSTIDISIIRDGKTITQPLTFDE